MRSLKVAGFVFGAFLIMALPGSAAGRFRRGFVVGPAFGTWGWYSPFYGFYGPYGYYGPYYGPYPGYYYSNAGQLKLKTNMKNADVYINGAYAGKAGKLKSMWLRPAAYRIEVRAAGYAPYAQRVYVMAGKTIKVTAEFAAPAER